MRNKSIALFILVLLCCVELSAQESYLKNRWNIKLSYAPYVTGIMRGTPDGGFKLLKTADFRLEGNYGVLNFLEVGVYLGYARYKSIIHEYSTPPDSNGIIWGGEIKDGHVLSYGINANFHIFPLFIKKPDFRFDLYVTAKYGGRSSLVSKNKEDKYSHEFGIGLGFAFYFSKPVGIFAEYSIGRYYLGEKSPIDEFTPFFPAKSTVRAGIAVKFKPKMKSGRGKEEVGKQ